MFYHFILPEPPSYRLNPNGKYKTNSANYRVQGEAKKLVQAHTQNAPIFPDSGRIYVDWHVFLGKGRKQWDEDNLIAALKYHQDTLARAIGVNDSRMVPHVYQYRDPDGKGFLLCTVQAEETSSAGNLGYPQNNDGQGVATPTLDPKKPHVH